MKSRDTSCIDLGKLELA